MIKQFDLLVCDMLKHMVFVRYVCLVVPGFEKSQATLKMLNAQSWPAARRCVH